jgi:hypothetical protein
MSYVFHVILLGLTIWLIGRKQPDSHIFYLTTLLKLIAGICLGLIYQHYYWGGDTFQYYNHAKTLADLPLKDWWHGLSLWEPGFFYNQPRAIIFTKIVSVFIVFTKGDYWIVSCYFSLMSALAFWFFYRQVKTTLPNLIWPVTIGFLLLPSTVFWSAGIMKGTLTNAAMIYICAFTLKLFYRKKIHVPEVFLTALSVVILYYIKYYLLIVVLPAVLYALFDRKAFRAGIKPIIRSVVYILLLVGTLVVAPKVNPNMNILKLPEIIHRNQQEAFQPTENDSSIQLRIEPTWGSLISSLPHALVVGLFGPSIFDVGAIWSWVPKIENLLLFLLTICSLMLVYQQRLFSPDILVMASLIIILLLAVMLPLAAPNFGALVRYKAPMTPFLMTLVLTLPYWNYQKRIKNK